MARNTSLVSFCYDIIGMALTLSPHLPELALFQRDRPEGVLQFQGFKSFLLLLLLVRA